MKQFFFATLGFAAAVLAVASCSATLAADSSSLATQILQQSGVRGGFVVQLGIGDGSLTQALRANTSYQVQGLDRDAAIVESVRRTLIKNDSYGEVAVDQLIGDQLPYIDNLVNLLVSEDLGSIPLSEVQRVLVPNGVAYLKGADGQWTKTVKPRPVDIDEWSHYFHDASGNAVAQDTVVGPPRHLQWVGSPRYSRHHDRMASLSALVSTSGRLFYIMDEGSRISVQLPAKWKLIARDAFNGTVLWKRDIPDWQNHLWPLKSGPTQLSRRLVADGNEVLVTLGYDAPISCIDGATGETVRSYADSEGTEEILKVGTLLFAVVRKGKAELADYAPVNGRVGDQALARELFWNEEPRILMAYEADSGKRLWARQTKISPLTLVADSRAVYFHNGETITAVDQASGEPIWTSQSVTRRNQFNFNFGPRLLVNKDVVLFAGGDGQMLSLSASDGQKLWSASHPNSGYQSPQDLMVVGGLVWCAPTTGGNDSGVFTGRDPKTGEVKKEFPPNVDTYWFHHRCYIAKATEKFILPSRTGIEFVSPSEQDWDIHHWVRGGCLYGVLPCNGLTYAPPHNCACYPEAKLFGFNALAPIAPTRPIPTEIPEQGRLVPGSAYDRALKEKSSGQADWPTFRHDNTRSGAASTAVPPQVSLQWEANLTGRLTAPVVADGKVFIARTDAHTLVALDQVSGQTVWQYTIGARIDSPPTIARGRVLFGGCDGWVYCLSASDGQLVWRYRAAPLDRRTMAYEQQESLWPVHGSVLVRDEVVYAVAGRSNFLDGGLRLVRLDLDKGHKLSETLMDSTNPETGNNLQEKIKILQMPVGLPDILSADDRYLYMKSQKFDFDGKRLDIGPHSGDAAKQASVQRGDGEHIFAPMGFLDDSWYHRSYWVHGQSFAGGHNGYYQAGKFAPSGQILVKGNGYVFGYGRKPEYLRWTTTMERQLFAAEQSPPENSLSSADDQAVAGNASNKVGSAGKKNASSGAGDQFPKSPSLNPAGKPISIEAWVTTTKPNGVVASMGGSSLGFALTIDQGKPCFLLRVDGKLTTVAGPKRIVGGWHHLVGVLDSDASMRLYVDGARVAEGKSDNGLIPRVPANAFSIGQNTGSTVGEYQSPNSLTGIIDELRLYFTAASDEQVAKRFAGESEIGDAPHLVLTFDDESFRDLSPFNNNGTPGSGIAFVDAKYGRGAKFSAANVAENQPAGTSLVKPKWAADVPIYVRALALCGDLLFMAGPPDIIDEEQTFKQIAERDAGVQKLLDEQDRVILGQGGGQLLVVNAQSGEVVHKLELKTLPAWDGMALAHEKVFMTTLDGKVLCLGK